MNQGLIDQATGSSNRLNSSIKQIEDRLAKAEMAIKMLHQIVEQIEQGASIRAGSNLHKEMKKLLKF